MTDYLEQLEEFADLQSPPPSLAELGYDRSKGWFLGTVIA